MGKYQNHLNIKHRGYALFPLLYSRIFTLKKNSLNRVMHHHKRFPFIKIKWLIYIHPLCCEGFTKTNIKPKLYFHLRIYRDIFILFHSEGFTKTFTQKLLCLPWNFTPLCVNISFTFTAVWKTNLQRVTDLPFHLCETTHGFETKQHTGFLHSLLLLLHCCAFFFFLHHKDKFTLLRFIHFNHCITILGFHWLLRSPVSLLTVCKNYTVTYTCRMVNTPHKMVLHVT